ncbi:MAG: ornithine carbamoyltransferase [Magnetococcales bacterium]|nr:ornithine carbamoyltransferase [Magnetococcales bacterium]
MTTFLATKRDLLTFDDVTPEEIRRLFQRTAWLKQNRRIRSNQPTLAGRSLGMIFEKPSTRTRVSFETGMFELGGQALFLSSQEIQLGRGEELSDSARVLSRYVDAIMVRTFAHKKVEVLAEYATVPVINGLSDDFHPCQVLADLFTYEEHRGAITGKSVAWIGDGNNMANSWIQASAKLGFRLVLACPEGYEPESTCLARARQQAQQTGGVIEVVRSPRDAVFQADLVCTDTWTSMGQEAEQRKRQQAFADYCVDQALMATASSDALFMHCLPAHRGEEVTAEVMDGPQSVIWDEAENRLHVQKALLEWLMGVDIGVVKD